jgi:adenylate kinase family enzyme
VIVTSASGNGGTTFARAIARRIGAPFVELDALNHGPGWSEASAEDLYAQVAPIAASDSWVIDGSYRGKLGDLTFARADAVVWLDQPIYVWLPRLLRRTLGRLVRGEELWAGNRETLRGAFGRDGLILWTLRNYRRRRREYPSELGRFNLVRLRTKAQVESFLESCEGVDNAVSVDDIASRA